MDHIVEQMLSQHRSGTLGDKKNSIKEVVHPKPGITGYVEQGLLSIHHEQPDF